MGWPRKDERVRLYFERKQKSYLLIDLDATEQRRKAHLSGYEGLANVLYGSMPSLCSTEISAMYLYRHCRRVQWSDMPEEWQKAMAERLCEAPENYRGLWRVEK